MSIFVKGVSIEGTNDGNMLLATHGAASALFQNTGEHVTNTTTDIWEAWNRWVQAKGGNDVILRDRPGDYKQTAEFNEWNEDILQFEEVSTVGNVVVSGGSGDDRVSYASYDHGGIEIDLEPVAQPLWNDPDQWAPYVSVAGTAKAYGSSTTDIFGVDYLKDIENATGTNQDDLIKGSDIGNKLYGLDGDDEIEGRAGDDTLEGGDGNDTIRGGDDHDDIEGEDGNDTLYGDDGDDAILGGEGHDKIYAGNGDDTVTGGDHNDKMWGGAGSDLMFGGEGNDTINTGSFMTGIDEANGGNGNDRISVGRLDTADGGAGIDTIVVDQGMVGNGVRVDINWFGEGTFGRKAADGSYVDIGTLDNFENVITGRKGDHIWIQDDGANEVTSKAGNDVVLTAGGDDTVDAGRGDDYVSAGAGNDDVIAGEGDDLVFGEGGQDEVDGGSGDDSLYGMDEDDVIDGGSGADNIYGGAGADVMTGGADADAFIWEEDDSGVDTITDFQLGEDFLVIQDFLKDPVPMGGSYVGKVFAYNNAKGNAFLSAKTDDGWEAFVELEGISANAAWDAIQSGELFSGGTLMDEYPGGPDGWSPQPPPFDDESPFGQIGDGWSSDSFFL